MRESTINLVGKSGTAPVSYNYIDYGETEVLGDQDFYNEVCYGAGIYDETTGLYYLNARYYSPENVAFLTQDTYRGDRSRTATLNYYSYCAGNPVNYTDPSGHALWGVLGAALGAYDGYKYAKKKKLKGVKKAAAIVGGAVLGAVNPFKVVKAAKKVYKAAKYTKKVRSTYKKAKSIKKIVKKTKVTKVKVKKYNVKKGMVSHLLNSPMIQITGLQMSQLTAVKRSVSIVMIIMEEYLSSQTTLISSAAHPNG